MALRSRYDTDLIPPRLDIEDPRVLDLLTAVGRPGVNSIADMPAFLASWPRGPRMVNGRTGWTPEGFVAAALCRLGLAVVKGSHHPPGVVDLWRAADLVPVYEAGLGHVAFYGPTGLHTANRDTADIRNTARPDNVMIVLSPGLVLGITAWWPGVGRDYDDARCVVGLRRVDFRSDFIGTARLRGTRPTRVEWNDSAPSAAPAASRDAERPREG